jgi:hypothetical protein
LIGVALAIVTAGCNRPLPAATTPVARLYVARCAVCHRAYSPHSLTATMWAVQVAAMEPKIAAAGLAPLTTEEEHEILDYLQSNAERG